MNRRIFETYVETQLAPTLDKGDVVIMDNLAAHKSTAAEKAITRQRRMAPVPAALQSRPQSDRNGLRQAQSPSARKGRQDHRRPLAGHRRTSAISSSPHECQNYFTAAGYGFS